MIGQYTLDLRVNSIRDTGTISGRKIFLKNASFVAVNPCKRADFCSWFATLLVSKQIHTNTTLCRQGNTTGKPSVLASHITLQHYCNVISKNCNILILLQITSFSSITNIKRHWRSYSANQSLVVFEDSRPLRQCCNTFTNVAMLQLAVSAKHCYFVTTVAC